MGEGREYEMISRRSRQILGKEVLPEDEPSKKSDSACPASRKKTESAQIDKDKRRSQVLQAQRTHRQRTQTYIKMLEREVIRLRESEKAARESAEKLQQQVASLLKTISESSLSPSAVTNPHNNSHSSGLSSHITVNIEGPRGVFVDVEDFDYPTAVSPVASDAYRENDGTWKRDSRVLTTPPLSDTSPSTAPTYEFPSSCLEDPRVGINFVLELEKDCMDHLRGKHLDHVEGDIDDEENKSSGHVFTACLSLWQQYGPDLATTATYEVSDLEINRLLSTSLNLGLTPPEITPVQIWHRIRSLEFHGGWEMLANLIRDLKEHVVCLGFGAVLNQYDVEPILLRYFTQLPP